MTMNFYISTNYLKIIRLGYYVLWYWQVENFIWLFHSELVTQKFYFYFYGGHYFTTSKTPLWAEKDSMLAIMFSGYHSLNKSEDGSYFIGADGTHFHTILNYLRGRIKDTRDIEILAWCPAGSSLFSLGSPPF